MFNMFKKANKVESFLGVNATFYGTIKMQGTLRVDGNIEGNVDADWVVLGERGSLKGDVRAKGIMVGGKIEGNLKADEVIEIRQKGEVRGDITSSKLIIVEGGILIGKSTLPKEGAKVITIKQAQ
ncbi:MAG TPA: polymer-forming cytoskeletal protein [Nitrospiraceae bacterium]|nr:polymer-forming cytoskeletal protein [Nitrospiraceae bacterium]